MFGLATRRRHGVPAALFVVLIHALLGPVPASAAPSPHPYFQLPFTCSESWQGYTYPGHEARAVDFSRAGARGSTVRASAAGTIHDVRDDAAPGPAHIVIVNHWNGWTTHYAHMTNIVVTRGQQVALGAPLGLVGSEGNATGPHLHYVQQQYGINQGTRFNGANFTATNTPQWLTSRNCPDSTPFADTVDSPHRPDVAWVHQQGITLGCAVDQYCPKDAVTRDQMASFLARYLSLPSTSVDFFTDDQTSIHQADINRIAAAGITTGCGGGRYCPTSVVTRDQMASFLARALDLPAATRDYFGDDNGSPHEADINRLAQAGITNGCSGGLYCPTAAVTREQMASLLARGAPHR